jgi:hypothetical protein
VIIEGVDPLRGQVRTAEKAPERFTGWLSLMRILEQLTELAAGAAGIQAAVPQRLGDQLNPG